MKEKIDPIAVAIKTEKDGIEFYKKAAQKTTHPFGKEMFLSFIEDEKRHLEILEQISREMHVPFDAAYSPKERIKTVFEDVADQVIDYITPTADETEALQIALEIENEGYEFYEEQAQKNPIHSKIFERLAQEESEHISILQNLRNYLDDTGHWFMYEEHQMVDGG
ncbi:MAG: ferritin family protein [Theionarchaea archaeon]|nr:ferritin family protein [Theionarchaea archaeon]